MSDQTIAWKILSRLSLEASDNSPVFFEQRQHQNSNTSNEATTKTAAAAAKKNNVCVEAVFLKACPLLSICNHKNVGGKHNEANHHSNNCLPALYSREAIMKEFVHVLQMQSSHGGTRISCEEMCMWLGMEKEDVELVGRWLQNELQVTTPSTYSLKGAETYCCKVYNPNKQQYEYALVEHLIANLRERIHRHCNIGGLLSASCSTSSSTATLEALSKNSPISSTAQKVTTQQLAHEMELTSEDVAWLLKGIASSIDIGTVVNKSGEIVEVYINTHKSLSLKQMEEIVMSALSGVTVPTLVCSCIFSFYIL